MTSRRPSATRVFTNDDSYHGHVPPGTPTLVDFLRASDPRASVACARGSKLFHVACDHDAMGFDADHVPLPSALPPAVQTAARFILQPSGPYTADQYRARVALARLHAYTQARRRFYLGVGLVETHAFNENVCHLEVLPTHLRRPAAAAPTPRARERLPPLVTWPNFDFWRTRTEDEQRRAIGAYYQCASHVDGTIGALYDGMRALNLTATTAVIVQGDHGFSLGRHGRWSKYNLYDEATRVPLLMVVPGGPRGRRVDEVAESLDVMPTLLDLWGVPHRVTAPADATAIVDAGGAAMLLPSPRQSHYYYAASVFATSSLEALQGSYVALDGTSLMPHLARPDASSAALSDGDATATAAAPQDGRRRLSRGGWRQLHAASRRIVSTHRTHRRYARSELHLPCGVSCPMLNQPYDGLPPGYTRTPTVGAVSMLYVRTKRWAYTAVLRGTLPQDGTSLMTTAGSTHPRPQLIDELLFDHRTDPNEHENLAYFAPQRPVVHMLRAVALRDWGVRLHELPPPNASRWQRAEWLRALTGFRANWWKR